MNARNPFRPLSALLSQTLVAFTVEFDNEFERRMRESGYPVSLSMTVWRSVMRFLAQGSLSVQDLTAKAPVPPERVKSMLGCLERWRFVRLAGATASPQPTDQPRRDGWGSGRGIRADWMVSLTFKGAKAVEVWRPLTDETERRWQERFGRDEMKSLRSALEVVIGGERSTAPSALPALLSQALRAFTSEFDGESTAPLDLSANTLRVLSGKPVRESDIPRLTGASPETSGLGWQVKRYVQVETDSTASRGKVILLTALGLEAQRNYYRLVGEIEKRWEARFGQKEIRRLRDSLEELFERRDGDGPLLSKGLVPPPGVIRSGQVAPALGRKQVAPAARKRAREMAIQTEAFVRDPAGALPHYPLWDMNRGFGP